jgi:2-polyprenyl-3-methyl-5-hydroxy-6-metoxy-1,4-benzoquinol methylase
MNEFSILEKFLGQPKSCIICQGKEFESWAKIEYLEARRCINCGMISVNPHLTEEGLIKFYDGYFKERTTNEGKLFEQRWKTYEIDRKWLENFIEQGKILDVGCSGGHFLSTFDSKKWDVMGVEIEKEAADFARKEYGIPVRVGKIIELEFEERFDVIVMRGVIEHFSDPIQVLEKCTMLLKPSGYLFITATPAGDSFAFDVYREKWVLFTPISHIHFFTVNLLSRILKKYKMNLISQHYQYQETPYANPQKDYTKIKQDIILKNSGKTEEITNSVPFPGSMITAIWKKSDNIR